MPIKNFTTSISAEKTVMEIQTALAKHGASAIMTQYDEEKIISKVSFKLYMPHGEVSFQLPANTEGVFNCLVSEGVPQRLRTKEQAARVAWRIVKDWVTAQLAIVEAQMVEMPEVFLPYADAGGGKTVYELMKESPDNLLGYAG